MAFANFYRLLGAALNADVLELWFAMQVACGFVTAYPVT